MKFTYSLLLALILLSPISTKAEEFNIAVAKMPPYVLEENGQIKGILVDITKKLFERIGHEVHFQFFPWPRAIQNLKNGRVHGIIPFFKTKERETYSTFVEDGLVKMNLVFFRAKGSEIKINQLEDAEPYRIVKVDKASLGHKFHEYQTTNKLKVQLVPNTTLGVRVLASGRVDLMASVETIARYAAKHQKLADQIEVAGKPFKTMTAYLALSSVPTMRHLVSKLEYELATMKADGTIDQIYSRYLNNNGE